MHLGGAAFLEPAELQSSISYGRRPKLVRLVRALECFRVLLVRFVQFVLWHALVLLNGRRPKRSHPPLLMGFSSCGLVSVV